MKQVEEQDFNGGISWMLPVFCLKSEREEKNKDLMPTSVCGKKNRDSDSSGIRAASCRKRDTSAEENRNQAADT